MVHINRSTFPFKTRYLILSLEAVFLDPPSNVTMPTVQAMSAFAISLSEIRFTFMGTPDDNSTYRTNNTSYISLYSASHSQSYADHLFENKTRDLSSGFSPSTGSNWVRSSKQFFFFFFQKGSKLGA